MKTNRYNHVPIVPTSEKERSLVMQINSLFDDVYIRIGKIQEALKALEQGDEEDVNEND